MNICLFKDPPPPGSNIYRPTPVSVNGNVGFPTVNGARPTLPYAASTDNSMPFMTNGVYPPSTAPALQLGQPGANAPGSGYAPSPHPPYNTGFTGQTNGPQQTAPTPSGTPWATPYPPSYPPAQGQYPPPTGMHLPQDGRRQYPQQVRDRLISFADWCWLMISMILYDRWVILLRRIRLGVNIKVLTPLWKRWRIRWIPCQWRKQDLTSSG